MNYPGETSHLQILLDDMVSVVEQFVMSETRNFTCGYPIKVSWTRSEPMHFLIVRLRCGNLRAAHAFSYDTLLRGNCLQISAELCDFVDWFLLEILHDQETLTLPDLAVTLWEEFGIALGGEW